MEMLGRGSQQDLVMARRHKERERALLRVMGRVPSYGAQ